MKLYNPTDKKVSITIFGKVLSVAPESETVDLKETEAQIWQSTHGFLEEVKAKTAKTAVVEKEETPKEKEVTTKK